MVVSLLSFACVVTLFIVIPYTCGISILSTKVTKEVVFGNSSKDDVEDLYKKYRDAVESEMRNLTSHRLLKNSTEYKMHVEKLKEVNGLKNHNLNISFRGHFNENEIIYINNPVEAKFPRTYLVLDEFREELSKRNQKQRDQIEQEQRNAHFRSLWKTTKHAAARPSAKLHLKRKPTEAKTQKPKTTKLYPKVINNASNYDSQFASFVNNPLLLLNLKSYIDSLVNKATTVRPYNNITNADKILKKLNNNIKHSETDLKAVVNPVTPKKNHDDEIFQQNKLMQNLTKSTHVFKNGKANNVVKINSTVTVDEISTQVLEHTNLQTKTTRILLSGNVELEITQRVNDLNRKPETTDISIQSNEEKKRIENNVQAVDDLQNNDITTDISLLDNVDIERVKTSEQEVDDLIIENEATETKLPDSIEKSTIELINESTTNFPIIVTSTKTKWTWKTLRRPAVYLPSDIAPPKSN